MAPDYKFQDYFISVFNRQLEMCKSTLFGKTKSGNILIKFTIIHIPHKSTTISKDTRYPVNVQY